MAGRKKRLRLSSRRLEQIGEHWLLRVLADVLVELLNAGHCALVFDRVGEFNAEIAAAAAEGRPIELDGDVRTRHQPVGVATQHRI